MSLINELKRRNVLRIGAGYVVTAWLIIQVVETIFPVYGLSDAAIRYVITGLAVGFVPALILAWAFEWTPEGIRRESEVDHSGPAPAAAAAGLGAGQPDVIVQIGGDPVGLLQRPAAQKAGQPKPCHHAAPDVPGCSRPSSA